MNVEDISASLAVMRMGLPDRCSCTAPSGVLRDELRSATLCADCGQLRWTDREAIEADR